MIKKIKKPLLYLIALAIILAVSFKITQARSLSFHFVDEEDHITYAYYINKGYQLHRDLQGNHQPLVYFVSAAVQKITKPTNIFMLIRRHRQVMFLYGAIWSLLLVWRFKSLGLAFVLLFEYLKYFLFGDKLLMETLAVYPTVYFFGVMADVLFKNNLPSKLETLFLGVCTFLIIFNMVPLWPWLFFVWLVLLIKNKKGLKLQIVGTLTGILGLFTVYPYSPIDWFRETIWNNFFYAIPQLSPFHTALDWVKMIFFPFLAMATTDSLQANFISFFITGWLITFLYLIFKKDKRSWWVGLMYLFLLLANNRVLSPGAVFYHGFHLLPWMGLMTWVFVFCIKLLIESNQKIRRLVLPIFIIWGLILMSNKNMPYFLLKTDAGYEYYVNYSTLDDFNFAIKTLVNPGDRLAVTANEPIIYWNTGAELATRQVIYGGWEPSVKELKEDYQRVFYGNNPPEIIYGDDEPELLKEKYINIFRNNKPTQLFIREDKYEKITEEKWQILATRGFEKLNKENEE